MSTADMPAAGSFGIGDKVRVISLGNVVASSTEVSVYGLSIGTVAEIVEVYDRGWVGIAFGKAKNFSILVSQLEKL